MILRLPFALAALVLVVASRGDLVVVGTLLAVASLRPLAVVALGAAVLAVSWRWASTSLEAVSGAQAVLGPAVAVGPAPRAVAMGLAAAAVLLAVDAPGARPTARAALVSAAGATAGVVVAGPDGSDLLVRVGGLVAGLAAAHALRRVRDRLPRGVAVLEVAGLVGAVAGLVLVARDAPGWDGVVDGRAAADGAAVGLAVAALVAVGLWIGRLVRDGTPGAAAPGDGGDTGRLARPATTALAHPDLRP